MTLDDLLVTFARSRKPLAVVLDEYGGTAGIISPDDILELIVGPAVFDNPRSEPQIARRGANVWEIDARASLDEINRALDIELDAEDADRLSGWVQYHAERIPTSGRKSRRTAAGRPCSSAVTGASRSSGSKSSRA